MLTLADFTITRNGVQLSNPVGMAQTSWFFLALGVGLVCVLIRQAPVRRPRYLSIAALAYGAALVVVPPWIFIHMILAQAGAGVEAIAVMQSLADALSWALVAVSVLALGWALLPGLGGPAK